MYDAFYGFTSEPFRLSPDAQFCFRHRSFSKAKSYFNYALHHGEGFVLVTGRPGTGKTTLIEDLLKDLSETDILTVRVDSAQVQADDLLRRVAYAFGLEGSGVDKATLLHRLEHYLHQRVRENSKALLIVDEAQALPADALEELRLITNLTNYGQPLVQIFLVGQVALRDTISDPALEQLHQRILCACHLNPLPLQEMRDYLAHRLQCAGWRGDPVIEAGAIRALYQGSGGIPRLINKLADRLLLHGGLEEKHVLTAADAEYVLHELRTELLLKEDPLSAGDVVESDVQIEDIRLQVPTAPVSGPELDQPSDTAAVQPEWADANAPELPDTLAPMHPDGPQAPHPISDPRPERPRAVQEPPTTTARTPGASFTEVFPPEELNRVEAPGQDVADIPALRLRPARDNGGVDPEAVLGAAPQPAKGGLRCEPAIGSEDEDAQARVHLSKDPDTGGASDAQEHPSGYASANKASERGSSHRQRRTSRRNTRSGIGVALTVLLLMVLGSSLFLLRGEGMGPIDGMSGLWSGMRDRLRQVTGRNVPDNGEMVVVTNVPEQGAMQGSTVQDSAQGNAAVLSALLKPPSDKQVFEWMPDDAPSGEFPSAPPESIKRMPGPETEDLAEPTRVVDPSVESAKREPDFAVSNGVVSPAGLETGTTESAGEIPRVSIASGRRTGSASEFGQSPEGTLAGDSVSVDDVSEPESTQPDATDSAEARLADLVEAVEALGIETESVGPGQVRLILRNAVAFDFDSARVPADAYAVLDRLSTAFVKHGDVRARIVGHTDDIGKAAYNRLLSARRAAAIQRHLVSRGVAADRLSSSGQGEDEPLVPLPLQGDEPSRDERIANRRIELWIEPIGGD